MDKSTLNNTEYEAEEDFAQEEAEEHEETEENEVQKKNFATTKKKIKFKDTDNHILADLQQRLIAIEYEFMMIREKLFVQSAITKEPKLNTLGKQVKKRLRSSL
jgi:hypothetical protein